MRIARGASVFVHLAAALPPERSPKVAFSSASPPTTRAMGAKVRNGQGCHATKEIWHEPYPSLTSNIAQSSGLIDPGIHSNPRADRRRPSRILHPRYARRLTRQRRISGKTGLIDSRIPYRCPTGPMVTRHSRLIHPGIHCPGERAGCQNDYGQSNSAFIHVLGTPWKVGGALSHNSLRQGCTGTRPDLMSKPSCRINSGPVPL